MGDQLSRTRVVKDTLHPVFNSTFRMLVHNVANEKLHVYVLDNNKMVCGARARREGGREIF